jgi:hypothetical protein
MLRALVAAYPRSLGREQLAEASHQSVTSSGFEKNLSTLRTLGVIDYRAGREVIATDLLFPEDAKAAG